jgi:hypothetical protein
MANVLSRCYIMDAQRKCIFKIQLTVVYIIMHWDVKKCIMWETDSQSSRRMYIETLFKDLI